MGSAETGLPTGWHPSLSPQGHAEGWGCPWPALGTPYCCWPRGSASQPCALAKPTCRVPDWPREEISFPTPSSPLTCLPEVLLVPLLTGRTSVSWAAPEQGCKRTCYLGISPTPWCNFPARSSKYFSHAWPRITISGCVHLSQPPKCRIASASQWERRKHLVSWRKFILISHGSSTSVRGREGRREEKLW